MGGTPSRLVDSTPFAEYIVGPDSQAEPTDGVYSIRPTSLEFEMHSTDQGRGLFTDEPLTKGTLIALNPAQTNIINDGVFNWEPLILASTSTEAFQAWHVIYNGYHNFDRIHHGINVRPIGRSIGSDDLYEVIEDIPANTELLRYYGIVSWFLIATLFVATRSTLAGYVRFFALARTRCHPKYSPWIEKYIEWMQPHLLPIAVPYTDPNYLSIYDQQCEPYTESLSAILISSIPPDLARLL